MLCDFVRRKLYTLLLLNFIIFFPCNKSFRIFTATHVYEYNILGCQYLFRLFSNASRILNTFADLFSFFHRSLSHSLTLSLCFIQTGFTLITNFFISEREGNEMKRRKEKKKSSFDPISLALVINANEVRREN